MYDRVLARRRRLNNHPMATTPHETSFPSQRMPSSISTSQLNVYKNTSHLNGTPELVMPPDDPALNESNAISRNHIRAFSTTCSLPPQGPHIVEPSTFRHLSYDTSPTQSPRVFIHINHF